MASRNNTDGDADLDELADLLRAEVAQQYNNMSVEDYFSRLASVSLGPLTAGRGNESGGEEMVGAGEEDGEGVEISSGVAWTLVAPLILLVVLVLVGVTVGCLWRVKDRRCQRRAGGARRDEPPAVDPAPVEIEMQELHGDVRQDRCEPGAGGASGSGESPRGPLQRLDSASRVRLSREVVVHLHRHQRHVSGLSGDGVGIPDKKGIQLLGQEDPGPEILLTNGPDVTVKPSDPAQGSRQDVHKESAEKLTHGLGVGMGEFPNNVYCTVCQHYMAQRYQNLYHRPPQNHHHPHPPHPAPYHPCQQCVTPRGNPHGHKTLENLHCRQCALSQGERQPVCRDASLRLPHTADADRLRLASQSLDNHLHLAPRYQPPHPAAFRPHSAPQDPVRQRLLQHAHEVTSPGGPRGSPHGLENPLFSVDLDFEEPSSSVFRQDSSEELGRPGRGKEERGQGRRDGPRIINSTSMMSTYGGESDPTQSSQGRGVRRHTLAAGGKLVVEGPDVSSIKMVSSLTSQTWQRASCRLLPTATLSSSETPSYHTTSRDSTTNDSYDDDDDDDDEERDDDDGDDEHEETLSLPSSISRFHASRVQFPPLMPDAQYPLTSTKAFYSPSWLAQSSRGEHHPHSEDSNILEALENFSDNTSMQPNVGSSLTSGPVSDIRESQTLSSSVSDPWAAPSDPGPEQTSPVLLEKEEDLSKRAEKPYERNVGVADGEKVCNVKDQASGNVHKEKTRNQQEQRFGDVPGHHNGAQTVGGQSEKNIAAASPSPTPRGRHGKSEPSSPHIPRSASELHRARIVRGKKRKEQAGANHHKQGFFLIPKQDMDAVRSRDDTRTHHQTAGNASSVGLNIQAVVSPKYLASPSRRRTNARPPASRKTGVSMIQESSYPSYSYQPGMARDLQSFSRADFLTSAYPQYYQKDANPLSEQKGVVEPEPHPIKLFSCNPAVALSDRDHAILSQGTNTQPKEGYAENDGKVRNAENGHDGSVDVGRRRLDPLHQAVDLMASDKTYTIPASFPAVNQGPLGDVSSGPRPAAATLDYRTPRVPPRVRLKRTKSQEDHAYVNRGGSFIDDLVRSSRNRNVTSPFTQSDHAEVGRMFSCLQPDVESGQRRSQLQADHQVTPSRGKAEDLHGLSNARTESQILAEVFSSFPGDSVSPGVSNANPDTGHGRQHVGAVATEMTIPTAFADELFGIWSLSPELDDISPSKPRTALMTPLKEEAKRANRKFIWGNSGSQSGSTSTSSFAAGWPLPEDASLGARRPRNSSAQTHEDNGEDYVLMDKNSSDQPRNMSAHMSISDSPSINTVPPTPTVENAPGNDDIQNANDPSAVDDYRSLPLTKLSMSQLYVISGYPDKDSVNNNAASDLFHTGRVESVTSALQANATSESDVQNRNATAAFAIVLEEQKYWL